MELKDDNILKFWQWFVKNEKTIQDCIENTNSTHREYVVDQMNEHILGLGVLTWDIGLNDDNNWFLTLSPNGNHEMLIISQKIMVDAPEHMDWFFYASKPAKNWNRQFFIYDDNMDEVNIDASLWHYIVFEEEVGKLELVLEAKNMAQLGQEVIETAAEQFLIHELGEVTWIQNVASVEIVHTLEDEFESTKTPVTELKEHFLEILQA